MRLRNIKLSGFISFATATNIEIRGQLVGVVGPNGCGKSNVIDAVRWVLGESSAKQLRGESMQDVIFNGSLNRTPVSRAHVELIFDNSAKLANGLWNTYDEISIKRMLTRQGESVYYINNQTVRRKDITDLFLGTGVGNKGYAVIEQGMISRIIEARPEELRMYLEEASGVSKYRERRKETLLRLNDAKDNLIRLEDINSELIKQVETLTAQSVVAKQYQALHNNLEQKKVLSIAIKVDEANSLLITAKQNIQEYEVELSVLGEELAEINQLLEDSNQDKQEKEQELHNTMMQFNQLRTNLARVEERNRHYSDLLNRFAEESHKLTCEEQELNQQLDSIHEEICILNEQIEANSFKHEEKTLKLEEKNLQVIADEEAYNLACNNMQNVNSQYSQSKHELDLLKNNLQHKKQQSTNLTIRLQRLEQETQTLDFNQDYFLLQQEIDVLNAQMASSNQIIVELKNAILQNQIIKDNSTSKINKISSAIATISGQITTLNTILVKQQKTDFDVSKLIKSEDICGNLWQSIKVDSGYELACEIALANQLMAYGVTSLQDYVQIPQSKLSLWHCQQSSFTPNLVHNPNKLSSKVFVENPLFSNVYNILDQYYIVDNYTIGLQELSNIQGNEVILTKDGHILTHNYVVFNASATQDMILEHKNQLTNLEQERMQLELELSILHKEDEAQIVLLKQKQDEVSAIELEQGVIQKQLYSVQLEFSTQEQLYLQNQKHHNKLSQEIKLLQQEISYINEEIASIDMQIEERLFKLDDVEQVKHDLELKQQDCLTALNCAKSQLTTVETEVHQITIDLQLVRQKRQNLNDFIQDKQRQIEQAKQKLVVLGDEKDTLNNADTANEIDLLQQDIASHANKMQHMQEILNKLNNKIATMRHKTSTINSGYHKLQEKINQAKFKEQEQLILFKTHNENLIEYKLNKDQLQLLLEANKFTLNELQDQIWNINKQIEVLGLVNLKAIEDLDIANSKHQELLNQVADLTQGIKSLEDAIMQIDEQTRSLMQETFDKLNTSMDVYFSTLFGGGHAYLSLTDTDILVAGLHIFANPPGKKNSSIHLLSGGEKALTAMSLVFALFNLNPAPFCLLDEVDAPLDDANTSRFCNLVKELSGKTQFMYISHNRLAMEMADQLVGVTMQEKGISTMVSVSLIDAISQVVN